MQLLPLFLLVFLGVCPSSGRGLPEAETGESTLLSGGITLQTSVSSESPPVDSLQEQVEAFRIQWYEWGTPAFDHAREEDKLVLLDLTSVWCHACHQMERSTYVDPEVIHLLNSRFIPIRVDSDQRPDIEARYRQGGWPTTAILLQTGEILYQANFLDPEEMKVVLQETLSSYRENKQEFQAKAAQVWLQIEKALEQKTLPKVPIEKVILDQSVATMYQSFDPIHGGFRRAPKFFEPEAIHFGFLHFHRTEDQSIKQMVLKTLDEQLRLFDVEWGGFFRYAENPNWTHPHYEKVLQVQAQNLLNYLEAYQATGETRYRQVAEGILTYVEKFLTNSHQTGFFSSQNSEVGGMSGKQFYGHPDSQRREVGLPEVDRSIYTHSNAHMIVGYLRAFQVLGEESYKQRALLVLNALYREQFQPDLGMAHVVVNGTPKWNGFIQNQVAFGRALLEAYLTTGEDVYLRRAVKLVEIFIGHLEDSKGGGFYDHPRRGNEEGLLRFSQKPIKDNVEAGLLLTDLYYVTRQAEYLEKGKRALQLVLTSQEALPIALLGTAVDRVLNYPLHVVVVGKKSEPTTLDLFQKALTLYIPGKIVRLLDPDRDSLKIGEVIFPPHDRPQAFVCTDKFCSQPISESEQLSEQAQSVIAATAKSRITGGNHHAGSL